MVEHIKQSERAMAVELRTYCRPLDEDGSKFETRAAMIKRSHRDHHERLWQEAGGTPDQDELTELENLGHEGKAFVAGRVKWLGGTPYAYSRPACQFNCFTGRMKVITLEYGCVPFADLKDKSFHVLNRHGEYVPATCRSFGVQSYGKAILRSSRITHEVEVTANHRWWTTDRRRLTTIELTAKDKIPSVRPIGFHEDPEGFLHGLTYADGSIASKKTKPHVRIRLCKAKAKYLPLFDGYSHSYPPSAGGDPFVYLGTDEKVVKWKSLPETSDLTYLAGFIRGLLAGDGNADGTGVSGSLETIEFVKRYAHIAGIITCGTTEFAEDTNFGKRTRPTYRVGFKRKDRNFRLDTFTPNVGEEEVFCCVVPGHEEFTLQGGILTSNCSYNESATVYDLVDISWLLLNGSGVGFTPRVGTLHGYRQPMGLEIVPSTRDKNWRGRETNREELPCASNDWTWTIDVGDSAQAWAKAGGKMFNPRGLPAKKLRISVEQVRGPGGRLKGYGWLCNGAAPLVRAFQAFHEILNQSAGQLLDEMQIMDVVNWWGTVLSSRRAAELALLDADNPRAREFSFAKKDYFICQRCGHYDTPGGTCSACGSFENNQHRRQSNNTLVFWSKPSRRRIEELIRDADACGGDPGICNGEAAVRKCPWFVGANPCVPAGTRILTDKGYRPIETLIDTPTKVWNGEVWSEVTPRITGYDRPVVRVTLSDGSSLTCTTNHKWLILGEDGREKRVEAASLVSGMRLQRFAMPVVESGNELEHAWSHGFYCGDGFDYEGEQRTWLYSVKKTLVDRLTNCKIGKQHEDKKVDVRFVAPMPDKFVVPHDASVESRLEWLSGLLDADGSVCHNPNSVSLQLGSVNEAFLNEIRLMLTTLGVCAKVTKAHDEQTTVLPDGRGGEKEYPQQAFYRLLINATDTYHLVRLGLSPSRLRIPALKPQRDARRFVTITAVEEAGIAPVVYCFTEPLANRGTFEGIVTGQCFEILLPPRGFCNLVTTCIPRFKRNFAALMRAIWIMARANYRQTCVNLEDGVLQPTWHQTNQALRLCGSSLTGIVQADWLTDYQIRMLRNAAITGAWSMADELKMPRPKAVCTQKPEGTGTKTLGSIDLGEIAEGVNRPIGRYIQNWINFSVNDPIIPELEKSGYKILPNPSDSANLLAAFPVEFRNVGFETVNGKEVNFESAVSQLDRYLRWQNLWCDYNVSATISYSPHEIPEVVEWIDRNWDNGFIAVALQQRVDPTKTAKDLNQPYLPQEVQTRDDWMEYASRLRPVDWSKLTGIFDIDSGSGCNNGVCPAK